MLDNEIDLLYKIYNTLGQISTRGKETLYMAHSLEAIEEIINSLQSKNIVETTINIPLEDIMNNENKEE